MGDRLGSLFTGRLWRHSDFLRLWIGQSISLFGSQITDLALPTVAILLLGATPLQVGVLNALQFLPFLLLGLLAGVMVDRWSRRMTMIGADLGRMLILASIPAAFLLNRLGLGQLFLVAFVAGVGTVFFDVAYQAYLIGLVERENLVEGNSRLALSDSAASLLGPAIAGLLIQFVGAARAIGLDAASFLVSAISLITVRRPEHMTQPRAVEAHLAAEIREGLRFVFANPMLRNIVLCGATHNIGAMMVQTVFLIFVYRRLGLSPAVVGIIFAIGGAAILVGAATAAGVTRRIGVGRTLLSTQLLTGAAYLIVPLSALAVPVVVLGVSQVMLGFLRPVFNITQVSLRQAMTPDRLQGRMTASIRTVIWGVYPLGALLGGALGNRFGLVPTMLVGGFLSFLASAWLIAGPLSRLHEHPGQPVTTSTG